MVYKKYIKRDGKLYGPYIYKSVREGNKVITKYIGQENNKGSRKEPEDVVQINPNKQTAGKLLLQLFALALFGIFLIIFFSKPYFLTNASLELLR